MAYWLFKSEPSTWSWDDQLAHCTDRERQDSVRNYQARNKRASDATGRSSIHLPLIIRKSRDGIVEICTLSHPDSRASDPRWDCVDIRARWRLPSHSGCVEQTRLSVQPVREAE